MKFITTTAAVTSTLLSLFTLAVAAPTQQEEAATALQDVVPTPAGQELWKVSQFRRLCDPFDTACVFEFAVSTNVASYAPVPCRFTLAADAGRAVAASKNHLEDYACGPYHVSVGWNGQFGEGNGFVTLAVVDFGARMSAWYAWSESKLEGGLVAEDAVAVPVKW
ncbi:hypothetical protein QBC42DRAFT_170774 [Cladorrhinum samala]|uniref:Uncharacterized protein n=1 Tax=Cladorrhinum samala TaxID=585594 RepID=A0AAV9HVD3_9PEZI|nr:hypothetical protein QBC42DRAFT_170774 [Cladorrhinum samala]